MDKKLAPMIGKRVLLRQLNDDGWLEMRGTLYQQPEGTYQLNAPDATKSFNLGAVVRTWEQEAEGEGTPEIQIR